MANAYKVLGQLFPATQTLSTLYTVPGATSTVCSSVAICNQGNIATTYRLAVRPAGASISSAHYLVYGAPISPTDTIILTVGLSLAATDVVSVWTNANIISFSLFGTEIT
jgi:hypothetical protein